MFVRTRPGPARTAVRPQRPWTSGRRPSRRARSRSGRASAPISRSRSRTLDGRYHVVDRIAAGGMGEVFRAHDAVLDREVAIKVLHRQPVRRLRLRRAVPPRGARRRRTVAPNIVTVHDWGAVDGIYYMVMEYVARPERARPAERRGPARAGAGGRHPAADARRARPRAPSGHRPPRHQARERHGHPRRRREGRGLRTRARVRGRADHRGRPRHGDGAVPRARAAPGRAGGSAHRPVRARRSSRSSC